MKSLSTAFVVDQHRVHVDGDLVSLNDIYALAGSPAYQEPYEWSRLPATKQLIEQLAENLNPGKSRIWKSRRGQHGGGTWAHKLLAVEYAGYLSPDLKLKINETFLRAESGDVALAAEIAERASPADQRRLAMRLQGIVRRNELTDELQGHGVKGMGFAQCTDAVYLGAFGATAKNLRQQRQLPVKANVRDAMTGDELATVMFAEVVARQHLEVQPETIGNIACAKVCQRSAANVRALLPQQGCAA